MTPKEKAKELVNKMWGGGAKFERPFNDENALGADDAKECAIVAVNEIIEALPYNQIPKFIYWKEVKTEIEKL